MLQPKVDLSNVQEFLESFPNDLDQQFNSPNLSASLSLDLSQSAGENLAIPSDIDRITNIIYQIGTDSSTLSERKQFLKEVFPGASESVIKSFASGKFIVPIEGNRELFFLSIQPDLAVITTKENEFAKRRQYQPTSFLSKASNWLENVDLRQLLPASISLSGFFSRTYVIGSNEFVQFRYYFTGAHPFTADIFVGAGPSLGKDVSTGLSLTPEFYLGGNRSSYGTNNFSGFSPGINYSVSGLFWGGQMGGFLTRDSANNLNGVVLSGGPTLSLPLLPTEILRAKTFGNTLSYPICNRIEI